MPYIQIGLIDPEHLPQNQKTWIENQPQEHYRNIVYITDGDESQVNEIHIETMQTPEELAEEIRQGEMDVTITLIDEGHNNDVITIFDALLKKDDEKKSGYYGGSVTYHID